jgi:hypothetical protein
MQSRLNLVPEMLKEELEFIDSDIKLLRKTP